eukprot:m.227449 g.227449  ORF g.227449 m.227449 type:complete len:931 (+) comp11588_c0_seq1:1081-3873(+)
MIVNIVHRSSATLLLSGGLGWLCRSRRGCLGLRLGLSLGLSLSLGLGLHERNGLCLACLRHLLGANGGDRPLRDLGHRGLARHGGRCLGRRLGCLGQRLLDLLKADGLGGELPKLLLGHGDTGVLLAKRLCELRDCLTLVRDGGPDITRGRSSACHQFVVEPRLPGRAAEALEARVAGVEERQRGLAVARLQQQQADVLLDLDALGVRWAEDDVQQAPRVVQTRQRAGVEADREVVVGQRQVAARQLGRVDAARALQGNHRALHVLDGRGAFVGLRADLGERAQAAGDGLVQRAVDDAKEIRGLFKLGEGGSDLAVAQQQRHVALHCLRLGTRDLGVLDDRCEPGHVAGNKRTSRIKIERLLKDLDTGLEGEGPQDRKLGQVGLRQRLGADVVAVVQLDRRDNRRPEGRGRQVADVGRGRDDRPTALLLAARAAGQRMPALGKEGRPRGRGSHVAKQAVQEVRNSAGGPLDRDGRDEPAEQKLRGTSDHLRQRDLLHVLLALQVAEEQAQIAHAHTARMHRGRQARAVKQQRPPLPELLRQVGHDALDEERGELADLFLVRGILFGRPGKLERRERIGVELDRRPLGKRLCKDSLLLRALRRLILLGDCAIRARGRARSHSRSRSFGLLGLGSFQRRLQLAANNAQILRLVVGCDQLVAECIHPVPRVGRIGPVVHKVGVARHHAVQVQHVQPIVGALHGLAVGRCVERHGRVAAEDLVRLRVQRVTDLGQQLIDLLVAQDGGVFLQAMDDDAGVVAAKDAGDDGLGHDAAASVVDDRGGQDAQLGIADGQEGPDAMQVGPGSSVGGRIATLILVEVTAVNRHAEEDAVPEIHVQPGLVVGVQRRDIAMHNRLGAPDSSRSEIGVELGQQAVALQSIGARVDGHGPQRLEVVVPLAACASASDVALGQMDQEILAADCARAQRDLRLQPW